MIKNYFSLILLLFLTNIAANAQADSSQQRLFIQIYSAAEREYGIDQGLINGLLFENKNKDLKGHPYLLNYYSNQGSVSYRGKHYSNLNLRYDIYAQQVLLIYTFSNVEYKLHLLKEFITGFQIENKKFINEAFGANGDAKFYQVIGEDFPIKILYYWEKGLSNVYVNNTDNKMFSEEQKKTFTLLDNKLVSFTGNRSFARNFNSKRRPAINEYFRKNKTKVKQANDEEMELLIQFINSIDN